MLQQEAVPYNKSTFAIRKRINDSFQVPFYFFCYIFISIYHDRKLIFIVFYNDLFCVCNSERTTLSNIWTNLHILLYSSETAKSVLWIASLYPYPATAEIYKRTCFYWETCTQVHNWNTQIDLFTIGLLRCCLSSLICQFPILCNSFNDRGFRCNCFITELSYSGCCVM